MELHLFQKTSLILFSIWQEVCVTNYGEYDSIEPVRLCSEISYGNTHNSP